MHEYKSQKELYQNLIPALNVKLTLLKNNNYNNITKLDIWNYLKEKEWIQKKNLELYHIVSDIMNCDEVKLDDYFKTVLERKRRRPIL